MGVNRGYVAFEFGILSRVSVDSKHGIKNLATAIGGSFLGLTKRGADKVGIGGIELLAQLLDKIG